MPRICASESSEWICGGRLRPARSAADDLLASYSQRIGTPIDGLFLCGGDAEPIDGISGRAGRIAAGIANAFLAREKRE